MIRTKSLDSFNRTISEEAVTLFYMFGPYCPACHEMRPLVEEIEKTYAGLINVVSSSVADIKEVTRKYNRIWVRPLVMFFYAGNEIGTRIVGSVEKSRLIKHLDEAISIVKKRPPEPSPNPVKRTRSKSKVVKGHDMVKIRVRKKE